MRTANLKKRLAIREQLESFNLAKPTSYGNGALSEDDYASVSSGDAEEDDNVNVSKDNAFNDAYLSINE